MISLEKFKALTEKTAIKKACVIVSSKIHDGQSPIDDYSLSMYEIIKALPSVDKNLFESIIKRVQNGENPLLIAEYLKALSGLGDVSWDYIKGVDEPKERVLRDYNLVLDNIRSPYNIGAIFRSAESFGVKKIYLVGTSSDVLSHPRTIRTSAGTINSINAECVSEDEIISIIRNDKEALAFSLECGGESLSKIALPENGYCIIGSEEFGVSKRLLDISKYILTINTGGLKGSLNVSVATGILLEHWFNSTNLPNNH